jgi:hypothetical protein
LLRIDAARGHDSRIAISISKLSADAVSKPTFS